MRAITTTMIALIALALPGVAAAQEDYPPTPDGAQVECSFDGSQVTCDGSGFAPDSSVTGTVKAPDGSTRRTDTLTANAQGEVLYRFAPVCDVDSLTVEMSGTDASGSATSDSDTVDISSCGSGGGALPRTGGGLALLGLLALAGAAFVRGRR